MVKHVILWTLKDEFDAEEKERIKAGIKEGLEGLKGKIPGMTKTVAGCLKKRAASSLSNDRIRVAQILA